MKYENIKEAVFVDRPNRFIANVLIDGKPEVCHVKNTGRCKELLLPGAEIYIQHSSSPGRKTQWDLIAVQKGDRLVNMDASAPNAVFKEWLQSGGMGFVPSRIKPEYTHGDSRFDFYFEHGSVRAFAEIKGVTLEKDNVVSFPDAPTLRGIKHLRGLMCCVAEGYDAYVVFIVQMKQVDHFEPAWDKHPQFGEVLREAANAGVKILAFDCDVTPDSLTVAEAVPVII